MRPFREFFKHFGDGGKSRDYKVGNISLVNHLTGVHYLFAPIYIAPEMTMIITREILPS